MLKKRLCIFLAVLVMGSLIITGSAIPAAAKTLKIGVLYTLSGFGSEAEIFMRNGAQLCQEWINEKGGITIKGEQYLIDLVVEDQKGSVDGAVLAATKLVERDQVKFIVGQKMVSMIIAVASVTEPAKVLRSSTSPGIPAVMNPDTPYTFRACPIADPLHIEANYDYLRDAYPDVKTVAVMTPDDPGGLHFLSFSEKEAEAHGFKVVAKEVHDAQEHQDFYPVWTKILLAAKPDAVDIGIGFPIATSLKLKQGRELGFKGPIFSLNPIELYTILDIVGKDFATDFFNSSLDVQSPNAPPMIKEMKKRWETKYPERFMFESFQAWDALWALVQAIEAAQSLDTTDVKTAWENMKSIETSYGTGHMGGLKTYGINHLVVRPTPISRLDKGKVELIEWYKPDVP